MRYGDNLIIPGQPALFNKRKNTIIIADLHLGFESEAAKEGMYLPRLQLKKSIELLEKLSNEIDAYTLVINGDLKHTFEKLTMQEREEVSKFLAYAKERFSNIVLVRGNHDNYITIITSRFDVQVMEELKLDSETLLVHGHRMPQEAQIRNTRYIIIGHEHPAVKISDELGGLAKYPCFLHMPLRGFDTEVLVLPAAGYYQTGNPVGLDVSSYLSPIVKKLGIVNDAVPVVFEPGGYTFEFPRLGDMGSLLGGGI